MTISGSVGMTWDVKDVRTSDLEEGKVGVSRTFSWLVEHGVGLNQADRVFQDIRLLTTGQTETLDLIGTLVNLYGTVTFAKLKAIGVYADPTNTTDITVSRPTGTTGVPFLSPALAALSPFRPNGGFIYWDPSLAGIAVAAGSDLVAFTNAAGPSATYYVFLLGTST